MAGDTTSILRDDSRSSGGIVSEFLVMLRGQDLGRRYELEAGQSLTVGRGTEADYQIDDDSLSRLHCRFAQAGGRWIITDLDSTNGTYVNEQSAPNRALESGDVVKIGRTIFKFLSSTSPEADYHEEIYRLAIIDGLTQLHNRRYLIDFILRELSGAKRRESPLAVLIFDIDRFKLINDGFGHLTGDYVLKQLAARLSYQIRRDELFARYGGDEFVVVLPGSSAAVALEFGERLRSAIENEPFVFEGRSLDVTISIGVGVLTSAMMSPAALIAAADEALYRAKEAGRNQVSA